MNRRLKIIFFIFPILAVAGIAHAENAPAFSVTYGDQKVAVSSTTLDSFYGYNKSDKNSLILYRPEPLEISISRSFSEENVFEKNLTYYHYKPETIYDYIQTLAEKIDNQAIEPKLKIEGDKATSFSPPKEGLKVDVYASTFNILHALEKSATEAGLEINKTSPQGSLAETNNLGITELIAEGVSTFKGSPNNRRHNITVGVEKFKGIIIKQGEEFSFNKYLGPVEKEQGFLPELVIKKTGTIPELGGGLCQVSSTAFRAAMQAGVPITERRNHAYAVQYYSPQGTDATIYPGVVDLKFINDTPGAILVWPYFKDKDTLIFDYYGTKDNRQVTMGKPVQYDRKTDGSMKATWEREVVKDGQSKKDVFKSIYQPPALYHKQEQFVTAATSTPTGLKMVPSVQ